MSRNSTTIFDPNHVNVGKNERFFSLMAGAGLLLYALIRLPLKAVLATFVAGYLVFFRGMRGYCFLYEVLGLNTAVEQPQYMAESGPAATNFPKTE
jgi:uncharacterized membrane protein